MTRNTIVALLTCLITLSLTTSPVFANPPSGPRTILPPPPGPGDSCPTLGVPQRPGALPNLAPGLERLRAGLRITDARIAQLRAGLNSATRDLARAANDAERVALQNRIQRINGELGDQIAARDMLRTGIDETRRAEYIRRNGTEPTDGPRQPSSPESPPDDPDDQPPTASAPVTPSSGTATIPPGQGNRGTLLEVLRIWVEVYGPESDRTWHRIRSYLNSPSPYTPRSAPPRVQGLPALPMMFAPLFFYIAGYLSDNSECNPPACPRDAVTTTDARWLELAATTAVKRYFGKPIDRRYLSFCLTKALGTSSGAFYFDDREGRWKPVTT